jgi:hypothetical protein
MPDLITNWLTAIAQNLIASFIAVIFGIGFTYSIRRRWDEYHFGRWHVVIRQGGAQILDRKISVRKAKEMLEEPSDLSVFLKGLVSPYATLNCDIIEAGKQIGLLSINLATRCYDIDLDKNPPAALRNGAPPKL